MPIDLEPTKQFFTHAGSRYSITCLFLTDDPAPTYRFLVDRSDDSQQGAVVADAILTLANDEEGNTPPAMNAEVVMRSILNRVTERIGQRIRAGQTIPMALDSSYWR